MSDTTNGPRFFASASKDCPPTVSDTASLQDLFDVLKANRVRKFEGLGLAVEFDPSALTVDTPATVSSTRPAHNPFFPKTEE